MTIGIGGSTPPDELARLTDMTAGVAPISLHEYEGRLARARSLMEQHGLDAIYVDAGTNLYYFTGTRWGRSERMVGALIPREGEIEYIAPAFEEGTLRDYWTVEAGIRTWQEHESPYALLATMLRDRGIERGRVGIDEGTAFFLFDGLRHAAPDLEWVAAKAVTAGCRQCKSETELQLMQRAKDMTMEVHRSVARVLKPGVVTTEVESFIDEAHRRVGAAGSSFCIVLFGPATAFPHGVKEPQVLHEGDVVLIDTGCLVEGYNSDITRTYVFGEPTARHREIWDLEKAAQAAGFAAAKVGVACGEVDRAARRVIEAHGLGPGYQLPGLPHRTGHGCGLDIHEWPYLVSSDDTPLAPGMCFSNEPMICVPGEFGVRLEDHFYVTADGPRWFTRPAFTIDDPFGLASNE
ncbi:MAG: aminopeptidase P family protein [Myxococcales bacterium FL481]|nr:MAG: aminopeptidase P family protein [Myxococcales bacterium FL481]